MFFRLKKSGDRGYVQIVENKREGAAVRQRVIANLGRADELAASGALASLIASGAKLTDQVLLFSAFDHDAEGTLSASAKRIGGPLLFGRIWERLGVADVLGDLLKERAFEIARPASPPIPRRARPWRDRSDAARAHRRRECRNPQSTKRSRGPIRKQTADAARR